MLNYKLQEKEIEKKIKDCESIIEQLKEQVKYFNESFEISLNDFKDNNINLGKLLFNCNFYSFYLNKAIYNLKKASKILDDNKILESSQKKKIDDKIKEKEKPKEAGQ